MTGLSDRIKKVFGRDKPDPGPAPAPAPAKSQPANAEPTPVSPAPDKQPPGEEPHDPVPPETLWNTAYDGLKNSSNKKDKALVDAYEKILSARVDGQDPQSEDPFPAENKIGQTKETRWEEMKKAIDIGLKSTEKASRIKGKINEGSQAIATVKGLIDTAVKASPEASVAWASVCFGLEIIANPISEPGKNLKGLTYVLSRMEWYWKLSELLLDENRAKALSTQGLRGQLKGHIVQLYQALLSYQMNSICLYHRNWAKVIIGDMFKVDDWGSQLSAIEGAEELVRIDSKTYNAEHIKAQLSGLLESSEAQESYLRDIHGALQDQMRREEERHEKDKNEKCLQDLRVLDPLVEKESLVSKKGGLLEASYAWILKPFQEFRENSQQNLFWIKGEPGKGKTMMMCGLIDELKKDPSLPLTYFFCQEPESNQNNATAVLRGLIWLLASQKPCLTQHIRKVYDKSGSVMFSEKNAWVSLRTILTDMLKDEKSDGAVLAIDALDECKTNRDELLDIIKALSLSTGATWIISSRDWNDINNKLRDLGNKATVNLKEHDEDLSEAIDFYIEHRMNDLKDTISQKNIDIIRPHLVQNTHRTFLWVGLVCTELTKSGVANYDAVDIAKEFPAELGLLYGRMMERISSLPRRAKTCHKILATICTVERHLSIAELQVLVDDLEDFPEDDVVMLLRDCGSFLSTRGDTVQLVHQSAKDFLMKTAKDTIFPSGVPLQHHVIFQTSISSLSRVLKRNIYGLDTLGLPIEQVSPPNPDPLMQSRYSLLFWDEHFLHSQSGPDAKEAQTILFKFLEQHLLHWLEALSLIGRVSDAITAFHSLRAFANNQYSKSLTSVLRDAHRFILTYRNAVEAAPLQVYAAPLIFSPSKIFSPSQSNLKKLFPKNLPKWKINHFPTDERWGACTFTLEHNGERIASTVFSADGKLLFSASSTGKLRTWDTTTGACLSVVDSDKPWSKVLLCDGKPRAFSSVMEQKIYVLDLMTGSEIQTLHIQDIEYPEIIGTNDSATVVIGSSDMITIWNPDTAECVDTLKLRLTKRTAGSPLAIHNNRLAVTSFELLTGQAFIKIWDLETKRCIRTLEGHRRNLDWLEFSGTESRLISASYDQTVKFWDVDNQKCLHTLETDGKLVRKGIFLEKENQVALGVEDGTMMVWDVVKGTLVETFHAHTEYIDSFASSQEFDKLASGSKDGTIKIWDMAYATELGFGQAEQSSDHIYAANVHNGRVNTVAVSDGGRYGASGAEDGKLLLWDAHDGVLLREVQAHIKPINSLVFGKNDKLATSSEDCTAKVWDLADDKFQQNLVHEKMVNAVIFHPDGRLVTGSKDDKIRFWDLDTESCVQIIECKKEPILLALSKNGERLAAVLWNGGIHLWNAATCDPIPISDAHAALISADNKPIYQFDLMEHPTFRKKQTAFPIRSLAQTEWWSTRSVWNAIDLSSLLDSLLSEEPDFLPPTGFAISADKSWILKDGEKILWLPVEFRPSSVAVVDSTIVLGCYGGQVLVLHFPSGSLKA